MTKFLLVSHFDMICFVVVSRARCGREIAQPRQLRSWSQALCDVDADPKIARLRFALLPAKKTCNFGIEVVVSPLMNTVVAGIMQCELCAAKQQP